MITLQQLSCYLPYGLKCQYEGIINGAELKAQDKAYALNGEPFDWDVKPIKGLKVGNLKSIHFRKGGWRCYIGIKGGGKAFYNGNNFKPVLRPLSDLREHFGKCRAGIYSDFEYYVKCIRYGEMEFSEYAWFFENHYDVFGLIEKNDAIDKNTLPKQ